MHQCVNSYSEPVLQIRDGTQQSRASGVSIVIHIQQLWSNTITHWSCVHLMNGRPVLSLFQLRFCLYQLLRETSASWAANCSSMLISFSFISPLKLLMNFLFAYFGKGERDKVTQCCLKLVWCIWLNECVQVQHLKYEREQRRLLDGQNMSLHLVQFHRLFAFYGCK